MHSVVHVNLHCRVASSHLHRPRANVERDVHFKKELDFLIYMRRLAAGVKPWQAVLDRYLATRRLTDQPATVGSFNTNIRRVITWLERTHPAIETFAQVTRDQILEFAEFLTTSANLITGRPLATSTRRQSLSKISVFFQDVVSSELEDVPIHPLIKSGALLKLPLVIPLYITTH